MLAARHFIVPALAAHGRIALTRDELVRWGEQLGHAARPPVLFAISGDLGAGKTTLVQAMCRGMGVRDEVTSPTFALVHQYTGAACPVYHLDLYRLEREQELTNIGWDDIVSAHAIVLVEWPDRAGSRLSTDAVWIALEHDPADPDRRLLLAG
ncbi:MAG TPA: tRNA (adenosine(37)-N6)-threonylcarbamoyltransferase complex ATPase subunit type 1 TsaE [Gemmatimonadaceae bacterium]|nr:tRNA (adenosine(37)-N6)-threonylcarbamoyltransferase complex ATPase subunit type 1 TsaE [Gemmatimonadaceae bacterium]